MPEFHAHLLADEMPLWETRFLLHHANTSAKKLNLFAGCRTPLDFDVRENLAGHVDANEQMQFGDEFALRPATLGLRNHATFLPITFASLGI